MTQYKRQEFKLFLTIYFLTLYNFNRNQLIIT